MTLAAYIGAESPSRPETQADAETCGDITELSPNYRVAPITEGFDWPTILKGLARTRDVGNKLYLVVFRSVRKPEADSELIARLDAAAHEEAMESDALFHYFAGELDEDGRALSWCLWTDALSARQALSGEAHQQAVRGARNFYVDFAIELYDVYQFGEADGAEVIFDRL